MPCVIALLIYVPSLSYGFIHDDHSQIVRNPQVHSWDYLPRLLSTDVWSQKGAEHIGYYYRPFFSLYLLIVHTFADASPWFWHLSSVLLHVVATYLVFQVCLELLGNVAVACVAASLFAIHPIHIESVCWISASNELLYTAFLLASLLVFLRTLRARTGGSSWIWLSVALWLASLLSKETALAMLPVFFLIAFLRAGQLSGWRKRLRESLRLGVPYLAAAMIYLIVRWLVLGRAGLETGEQTWGQVLFTSPSVIVFYAEKLFWPTGLSGFYLNPLFSAPTLRMWIELLVILLSVGALTWYGVKRSQAVALATCLLVLPIIPVLAGMRVFQQGNLAHDRYLYLSSTGMCILVGLLAKHLLVSSPTVKTVSMAFGFIALLTCFWLTVTQERFYQNDEVFYQRGLQVNPTNVLVIDYLGNYYLSQKKFPEAVKLFKRGNAISPEDPNAEFFLARGLFANGEYGAAEPYLKELSDSTRLKPARRATVLLSLGQVELRLNQLIDAEVTLRQLENENESYGGLHDTLGALYQIEGKIPEAQREYVREFQVSGDPSSGQKAIQLARLMQSVPSGSSPSGQSAQKAER